MLVLLLVAALLGVAAAGVVWSGFVLSILWGWFLVPTFGLPALSIPSAIGVALVVSYATHHYVKTNEDDVAGWRAVIESLAYTVVKPVFALLVGWIVKQWM